MFHKIFSRKQRNGANKFRIEKTTGKISGEIIISHCLGHNTPLLTFSLNGRRVTYCRLYGNLAKEWRKKIIK